MPSAYAESIMQINNGNEATLGPQLPFTVWQRKEQESCNCTQWGACIWQNEVTWSYNTQPCVHGQKLVRMNNVFQHHGKLGFYRVSFKAISGSTRNGICPRDLCILCTCEYWQVACTQMGLAMYIQWWYLAVNYRAVWWCFHLPSWLLLYFPRICFNAPKCGFPKWLPLEKSHQAARETFSQSPPITGCAPRLLLLQTQDGWNSVPHARNVICKAVKNAVSQANRQKWLHKTQVLITLWGTA